ncbi:MAG: alpha/beta fold hydrolase [Candidatus Eremiobacteraeota bacterium]|nr:alpha/beta fold hydrolase [Candidatus Eremiobacteraeota bacterium]
MDRKRFVGTAALTLAATQVGTLGAAPPAPELIRPFKIEFSETELVELRSRIAKTRWPDKETVDDTSQGVPLAMIRQLTLYWGNGYDWRKCESRLNALPNFKTQIDGLDIHFIHVRSKHDGALPLIVTHGWPGSIIEQLKIIEPLTDPTAHGGAASDAFHVVIPSIPGYGFSERPSTTGWDAGRIARAWVVLMQRLGYQRFVAQGGDVGALVTTTMGQQAPPGLLGIHTNLPSVVPADIGKALACGDPPPATLSADEKAAYLQIADLRTKHFAYAIMQATRPQTLYGLADSPTALLAWMLDHGDGNGQPAAAMVSAVTGQTVDGHSAGAVTRDDFLDNVTLYWLTNTGISAARVYWEGHGMSVIAATSVNVPAAVTVFPGELYQAPRSWTEQAYHKLIYFNLASAGGHFAAWEQPQIFAEEVRAGFRSLRTTGGNST